MNTADMVKKAQSGDEESFILLMETNKKLLYYTLKKYIQKDEDIADISQNTLLKAYKYIKKLKNPEKFKAWLICIALNEAKLFTRKRMNYIPLDENIETAKVEENFGRLELRDLVNRLEEDLKTIVTLHYFKDISIKEISKSLNIPSGTVKYKLHAARKRLLEMLAFTKRNSK